MVVGLRGDCEGLDNVGDRVGREPRGVFDGAVVTHVGDLDGFGVGYRLGQLVKYLSITV